MWANFAKGAKSIPWAKILRAIPWERIPWPEFKKTDASGPTIKSLSDRLDVVERDLKGITEAFQQTAKETSATVGGLSSATEILASRLLWALLLGGSSLVLGIICLLMLLFRH
jgi:hypothetical protein